MRESRRIAQSGFDDMWRQMDRLERLMDNVINAKRPPVIFTRPVWQPNVDICETAEHVIVLAELAGVRLEEIDISVDGLVLSISGARRDAMRGRKQRVYVLEINFGHFERLVPLPSPVDAEAAKATYSDGLLEIKLPKAQESRPRKIGIVTS